MVCKSIFITATGTDVGKTYVSGLLVKKMREFELNCGYYKPVLSGAIKVDDELLPGDCDFVVKTSNLRISPLSCVSYCFEQAVSPHLAAELNGLTIKPDVIAMNFKQKQEDYEFLVVEGAGGITCPLNLKDNNRYLLSDLINDLGLGIIIVADGGLGTINSVLLTVDYARARNIDIKGIILNNYNSNDFMHVDNKKQIEYLTKIKVVATVSKNEMDLNIDLATLKGLFI